MLVYDPTREQQVSSFGIVANTDDVFFDGARQRVYVSGEEGAVDVFDARADQGDVIAHELVHLRIPNHSPGYCRMLGRVMPDWKNWRVKLARAET